MLKELNEYLKGNMTDDYWYDDAMFICEDIIKKFSDSDWNELKTSIPEENTKWTIRLIECLSDIQHANALDCILTAISIEDEDVFIACVDAIRNMDISSDEIEEFDNILNKAKKLSLTASPPVKNVLCDFVKKFETI